MVKKRNNHFYITNDVNSESVGDFQGSLDKNRDIFQKFAFPLC